MWPERLPSGRMIAAEKISGRVREFVAVPAYLGCVWLFDGSPFGPVVAVGAATGEPLGLAALGPAAHTRGAVAHSGTCSCCRCCRWSCRW